MSHLRGVADSGAIVTGDPTVPTAMTRSTDGIAPDYSAGIRQRIMIIDGGFLAVVGAAQLSLEVLAHFLAVGPYAGYFDRSAYTIGWVEAHGLAAVIGVFFLIVGARDRRRFWHAFAFTVHLLLGAANLAFWQSFVDFGTVSLGELATAAHVLFATAQAWSLIVSRRGNRS